VQSPGVFWDDLLDVYHMWYVGDNGSAEQLGYAYSEDGLTWTRGPDNPVLSTITGDQTGDTIDAYRDGNQFRVLYGSFDFSGPPIRAIAEATVSVATFRTPILGWNVIPDSSGSVWFEPYTVKATNDTWKHIVLVYADTSTRIGVYGAFDVPENYVGTPQIVIHWTSTINTGDVEWDFDYRAIGGDAAESLDQSSVQQSVNLNDTAPGTDDYRMSCTLSLTGSNLAAGDTVEFGLFRDGTDGGDTLAGAVTVHQILFQYADA